MARHVPRILAVAVLVLAACGDPIGGSDTARGNYALVSVDDQVLPVVVSDDAAGKVEVTGGDLQLGTNGNCDVRRELRTTSGGNVSTSTEESPCTWTRTGSAIFLTLNAGGVYPGTWDESALTVALTIHGHTHTFAR